MILNHIMKIIVLFYQHIKIHYLKYHVFVYIYHNIKMNKNNLLFYTCHIYNKIFKTINIKYINLIKNIKCVLNFYK